MSTLWGYNGNLHMQQGKTMSIQLYGLQREYGRQAGGDSMIWEEECPDEWDDEEPEDCEEEE